MAWDPVDTNKVKSIYNRNTMYFHRFKIFKATLMEKTSVKNYT